MNMSKFHLLALGCGKLLIGNAQDMMAALVAPNTHTYTHTSYREGPSGANSNVPQLPHFLLHSAEVVLMQTSEQAPKSALAMGPGFIWI